LGLKPKITSEETSELGVTAEICLRVFDEFYAESNNDTDAVKQKFSSQRLRLEIFTETMGRKLGKL
jgi:hypothetical protein